MYDISFLFKDMVFIVGYEWGNYKVNDRKFWGWDVGGCGEGWVGVERVGWREGVSEWRGVGEKDGIR